MANICNKTIFLLSSKTISVVLPWTFCNPTMSQQPVTDDVTYWIKRIQCCGFQGYYDNM